MPRRQILSLEGRAAPRLYALAWILTLLGLGFVVAAVFAAVGEASTTAIVALLETGGVLLTVGLFGAAVAQGRQRRTDGWQDYFGPSPLLATLAFAAYSIAASYGLLIALHVAGLVPADSVIILLGLLINLAGYIGMTHLLAVRPGTMTWRDIFMPRHLAPERKDLLEALAAPFRPPRRPNPLRARILDVVAGVGLVLPAIIATSIFTIILVLLLGLTGINTSEGEAPIATNLDIVLSFIGVALIAPFGEEIFFRGFATNAWARSLNRLPAIARATLLFAAIHAMNTVPAIDLSVTLRLAVLAMAARLPVSLLLCWIYTNRKSLLASMTLHAAYNGSVLLIAVWALSQQ